MYFPIKDENFKGMGIDGLSQINVFVGRNNACVFDLIIKIKESNNFNDVLIYEYPENGLHYTEQNKLIEDIFRVACELNQQVFIKTHSSDIVVSFARCASQHQGVGSIFHVGVSIISGSFLSQRYSAERALELIDMGRDLR